MPYQPPPELASLSLTDIAELMEARKLPPVAQWNPEESSDSKMQITADGRWYHEGSEINRPAMVRAFSSLLRREADGSHWLVTPYEKQSIIVDDAPFQAIEIRSVGEGENRQMAFRLNTDDLVIMDAEHPLEMRDAMAGSNDPPLPYVMVRDGLWAKLARPVYYEMVEIALDENPDDPGIWSNGIRFSLGKSS